MIKYRRKATPALVWCFDGQPKAQWPVWVQEYETHTNMGLGKIGMSGVGALLVPVRAGNTINGQKGDYLVLENHGYDTSGKVIGGTLTLVKAQDFPTMFEEHPDPAAGPDKAQPVAETPTAQVEPPAPTPAAPGEQA